MLRGEDAQVAAVLRVLQALDADVLALQRIDWDADLRTISWLAERSGYPYVFAPQPNTGLPTGLDMNGDGQVGTPADAQGWGRFAGHGGMAILSRFPIQAPQSQDLSHILWRDLPFATLPRVDGAQFPSEQAQAKQRLSSVGHWIVPIALTPDLTLSVLTFHATPPVFDGPEDRNGLRNAEEIHVWRVMLNGVWGKPMKTPFVILGNANLDPEAGAGRREAITGLLTHPRVRDTTPIGANGSATVDWRDPDPGDLRVSYALPDSTLATIDSGVMWPESDGQMHKSLVTASRHRPVWLDIAAPP